MSTMTTEPPTQRHQHSRIAGIALLFLGVVVLLPATSPGAQTDEIVPTAVWSPTPTLPAGQPTLNNLIDGHLATSCCFLDDTPTGTDPKTMPPNAASPVTARFVLDLGKPQRVSGIRLVAAQSWANCMAENVSVFACDDREGKLNVRCLKDKYPLPPVNTFHAAFVTWDPSDTRYLSVLIHESYDSRRNGTDWWRGISPSVPRDQWRCNEQLRCQFGWWWGCWLTAVQQVPQTLGGPVYDVAGAGGLFTVQIAEVSCFCGQPADLPLPNPPHVAYPENRLQRDWMYQDCGLENVSLVANTTRSDGPDRLGPAISQCFSSQTDSTQEQAMVGRVLAELTQSHVDTGPLSRQRDTLSTVVGADPRWRELYLAACRLRRRERLKVVREWAPQFIYVKHYVFGGWTHINNSADELTDGQFFERNPDFHEGSQLCLATIHEDGSVTNEVLLDKPRGLIRDPNLSFDAKTLVFAMRDNFTTDDNHLYKMNLADRKVEQLTFSPVIDGKPLPCSDTEPCFAPNGDLIFQSTRCGQLDVCWAHPTSNLYTCDVNGRSIRRLAFDQVRTLGPQVLNDGRILYTRWEYSDRNPFFQQSLFAMNPDGTAQAAFYGNNSEYPAAMIHARGIPNSSKVIAVISGHHVMQKGKLAIIDRAKGSDGNLGIDYVAGASPDGKPGRQPSNVPDYTQAKAHSHRFFYDLFGHVGPQWQYPFAFDEAHYFVAFNPEGYHFLKGPFSVPFGVYFMTAEGKRELLAFDWSNSCGQAIPVMPIRKPVTRPSEVDWNQHSGTFYVQDVYAGAGLKGVPRGTIKRLRVVALEFRAAGVSKNFNGGITGGSHINTPVAIDNGSQDVKHVLGEVDVEEDGSVYLQVPARNAVYFQLLDEKGRCVQTMRSWTMVLPGERVGCVGCHESKHQTGLAAGKMPVATNRRPRPLKPLPGQPPHPLLVRLEKEGLLANADNFLGVNAPCPLDPQASVDGFSYTQLVQPIWDQHCVSCHQADTKASDKTKRSALRLTGEVFESPPGQELAGLRAFTQSYIALTAKGKSTPLVNWASPVSEAAMLPPYAFGSAQSKLMDYLEPSHYEVQLTDAEKQVVACWIDLVVPFCGSYAQANTWQRQEWRWWRIESNTWNQPQKELYEYFQMKRLRFAQQELDNVKALVKPQRQ